VGFEPTTAAFGLAKTVHALDHAATVIGRAHHRRVLKVEIAPEPLEVYSAMPKLVGRKKYIVIYDLRKLKTPEPLLFKSVHETAL
jgi:hypothetical protein